MKLRIVFFSESSNCVIFDLINQKTKWKCKTTTWNKSLIKNIGIYKTFWPHSWRLVSKTGFDSDTLSSVSGSGWLWSVNNWHIVMFYPSSTLGLGIIEYIADFVYTVNSEYCTNKNCLILFICNIKAQGFDSLSLDY